MNDVSFPQISLGHPILGDEEKCAVLEVMDSAWLTMGSKVVEFENEFANVHGFESAVAVSSCTAGLHLALEALDLGPGDEVLVPSLSFVATANAIKYVGATPVFVDIRSLEEPHISITDAASKLTPKTKAVIVVHYAGYLVDMDAWRQFADVHGLRVVEDAAHAPGAKGVGTLGDVTAFSFFSNKNMTTGEGGMVVARDVEILDRVRLMRAHGMTRSTLDRDKGHAFSYDVVEHGYNYRIDEIRAAIGIVQLKHLANWNERRWELVSIYREIINYYYPSITLTFDQGRESAAHIMTIVLPEGTNRELVMKGLRKQNIQSSIHYPPIHSFKVYSEYSAPLPTTEEYSNRTLTLPLHVLLSDDDVVRVAESLGELL